MDEKDLRDRFISLLSNTSKENPLSEEKIASMLGLKSGAEVRDKLVSPMANDGFPIGTAGRGIFLARSADELDHSIANHKSKILALQKRVRGAEIAQARLRTGYNPLEQQGSLF